jgi:hypothetical protein
MGIRKLWRTLCKPINTAKDKRIRASRELLRSYVLVLANSGIRTGEANRLKVTDIHSFIDDKQRKSYRLVVRGKTGRAGCDCEIGRSQEARQMFDRTKAPGIARSSVQKNLQVYCSSCRMVADHVTH